MWVYDIALYVVAASDSSSCATSSTPSSNTMKPEVIASKVFRTGVQTLEREGGKYYVTIRNRTYTSRHEIPNDKVEEWKRRLT